MRLTCKSAGYGDAQNINLDANTIDANLGAGIAITLDDTSNVIGNTTGRFRILNNNITNIRRRQSSLHPALPAKGFSCGPKAASPSSTGRPGILNSRIDGNTITDNVSHGIAFDISEDSEVQDLLIGDLASGTASFSKANTSAQLREPDPKQRRGRAEFPAPGCRRGPGCPHHRQLVRRAMRTGSTTSSATSTTWSTR